MTVRETKFEDYGLFKPQIEEVMKYCRKNTVESNAVVFNCAFETNEGVGADIFYSLTQDVSWERLDAIKTVMYGKGDFYAYRRKCMALIYKCIQHKDCK